MKRPIPKRNRSFGGCATCRNRRTKCDETRPECRVCRNAGLTCGMYETSLFFGSDDNQGGQNGRFRRPLLSVQERARMSERLVASVPPHLAMCTLVEIEERCEGTASLENLPISRGPFGAFKFSSTKPHPVESKQTSDATHSKHSDCPEHPSSPAGAGSPITDEVRNQETLNDDDNDDNDAWGLRFCRVEELDSDLDPTSLTTSACLGQGDHEQPRIWLPDCTTPRTLTAMANGQFQISSTAITTMKRYLDTVLKSLTPFGHSKTPWHILFVPLIKNCLAGITLQERLDQPSLCVFYGTLAMGSLSLNGMFYSSGWKGEADAYRQMAHEHMVRSIETAFDSPKKTKYKTQLMAILTMVQASIVSGNRDETEHFLLEAERFIRIRGLNRAKSRKVRLLHHCYAYERILFESTAYYYGNTTNDRRRVLMAIEQSGAMNYSQDSLSFRFRPSDDLESDMHKLKTREQGENDLHLELPGIWPSSLYPEIFGIPEVYMLLISMIIRLAKEKEADGSLETSSDRLGLKDFAARAKAIEKCIKQQRQPWVVAESEVDHLVEAVHHAVSIYFYRRIYDVDVSMLQCHVASICKAITNYDLKNMEDGRGSMRLIWPALIAATEAEDWESQTFFTNWFLNAARQTGLYIFDSSLKVIQQIWNKHRGSPTVLLDDFTANFGDDIFLDELMNGPL